jgi:transcription elongation factor GreA
MSEHESASVQSQVMILTPEGYERLQRELEELTTVKRGEIAQRLRDSKDHGEFSEDNSELDEVKFEQAMIENRISDLKAIFAGAQVITPELLSTDIVSVGNFVEVKDAERGIDFEVRLVCSVEADPDQDYISIESPMGQALFGAKKDDLVEFEAPAGKLKYKVVKIRI